MYKGNALPYFAAGVADWGIARMDATAGITFEPFAWYRDMRAACPVARDVRTGSVSAFCFGDVKRVLSDWQTFSSDFSGRSGRPDQPLGASLVSTDPPRHRQLRTLVTQAFTRRAVQRLAPLIEALVGELLDAVIPTGRMDVIDDLAYPLPVIVIAELLGIPAADRVRFKAWSDTVVTGGQQGADGQTAQEEMADYFRTLIAARRREPREDLISALLSAEIAGQRLSELELLGFCILLLVAGNETTTNLIGNALICLTEDPETLGRLTQSPELLPSAIEEVLRYRSPVQSMFRRAIAETELSGQSIRAGDPVVAWIGAANRDGDQFPEPDAFRIDRNPNQHLAFGHGIHFCLGAPLARLEAQIALRALLDRLPGLRRAPEWELTPLPSTIVYGVRHVHVQFGT